MTSAWLVGLWLIVGVKAIGANGVWHLGWGAALIVSLLIWLPCVGGYMSLKRLLFSNEEERDDETRQIAWDAMLGTPLVVVSIAWSFFMLGFFRFMDSFSAPPRGGVGSFVIAVLALHLLVWCATGLTQWALALRRDWDD